MGAVSFADENNMLQNLILNLMVQKQTYGILKVEIVLYIINL